MVDMKPQQQQQPGAPVRTARSLPVRLLRRAKFYVFVNAFICSVGLLSFQIVTRMQQQFSSSSTVVAPLLAMYVATVLRIAATLQWFNWVATKKHKIFGDKRHTLTAAQQRSIYFRILLLVIPTDCISFYSAQPYTSVTTSTALGIHTFLLEFALFIPKSLVFELVFDLFHYAAHWLCHQSTWLYQHVHKRHHLHLHPCPLSTYEQDVVDLCLTNVLPFVLAVSLGFPLSALQLHLMFAYKTYVEIAGHSGLELKGFSFPQLPIVNVLSICLRVHDHDLHHTHPKYNFSKRFALWDKVFGTFRPGRPLLEEVPPLHKQ